MTSLMQGFAKAKKLRLEARVNAIAQLKEWQKQQSLIFQETTSELHQMLDMNTKARVQAETSRLLRADQEQAIRLQEVQARASSTRSQLQENEQQRLTTAHVESIQRLKQAQIRAITMRSVLDQIREERLATALVDSQQRQQEAEELANNVRDQLLEISQTRATNAKVDLALRLQELEARENEVKLLLEKLNSDRIAMSELLWQDLNNYTNYIHNYVWGTEVEVAEPVLPESGLAVTETLPVAESEISITDSIETTSELNSTIEFIQEYVSKIDGHPSLVQVVNDRNIVRDLLASGANYLKVDPSEILNTLLKMVDLDN